MYPHDNTTFTSVNKYTCIALYPKGSTGGSNERSNERSKERSNELLVVYAPTASYTTTNDAIAWATSEYPEYTYAVFATLTEEDIRSLTPRGVQAILAKYKPRIVFTPYVLGSYSSTDKVVCTRLQNY